MKRPTELTTMANLRGRSLDFLLKGRVLNFEKLNRENEKKLYLYFKKQKIFLSFLVYSDLKRKVPQLDHNDDPHHE